MNKWKIISIKLEIPLDRMPIPLPRNYRIYIRDSPVTRRNGDPLLSRERISVRDRMRETFMAQI